MRVRQASAHRGFGTDRLFLLLTVLLVSYGTMTVFSAGVAYAEVRYGDALYFVKRQTVWLLIGAVFLIVGSRITPGIYKKYTPHAYALTLVLLVLVLAVGFVGNGAQRWISVGPLTIQPSEIGKLTLLMMLAYYFDRAGARAVERRNRARSFIFGTLIPFLIMLCPILLVMLQRHLSCIIILGLIGMLMIFISGTDARYLGGFVGLGAVGVSCIALFTDYTKERITVWQNPEAYKLTGGWQTLQGLMAIGSGGLFGVGYGESLLKHSYVSEPANDMIFAILCEESGFVGALAALLLFALLIWRGCTIALRSSDRFSRLVGLGIMIKLGVQVLLNVAVVTNTIPNTGISLPFFSYGGSSLIMMLFEMGIMLSVSRTARRTK